MHPPSLDRAALAPSIALALFAPLAAAAGPASAASLATPAEARVATTATTTATATTAVGGASALADDGADAVAIATAGIAGASGAAPHRSRRAAPLPAVRVRGLPPGYAADRVSTATRTDTDLLDIPQPVTVVTRDLIRDQAMQGIADAMRYVPGIGIAQGEGNRDTPVLRGNSSTADLFVDGMRDDVQYFRDLYDIERVEAMTGPNAMVFGRGGSGGVINRVSKAPTGSGARSLDLLLGLHARRRLAVDLDEALGARAAIRVSGLLEDSGSFRDDASASRRGLHPVLAFQASDDTTLTFGAERFHDERTADRGIPSFAGRPVDVPPETFFGDAARSTSRVDVRAFDAALSHAFAGGATLRSRTRLADYDKFYQNVFPGAVSADGTRVSVSAYNNATRRQNLLHQTDVAWTVDAGALSHTLVASVEAGRQETDNLRNTGFFAVDACPATGDTVYCGLALAAPRYEGAIDFRPAAGDADNHGVARNLAVSLQDQVRLGERWQAVLGLRREWLAADLDNHRTGESLRATDALWSPRIGLVYRAAPGLNLYASTGSAFLPRAGEQLASLSAANAALAPERFRNVEVGAKWQATPTLLASAAVYRLDRSNVAVALDASTLVLLEGAAQRVRGMELGLAGRVGERWSIIGAFAWQDGETLQPIRATAGGAALPAGTVLAQLPKRSLSLWNKLDLGDRWALGLGLVSRGAMFASTTNAVTLPGYVRIDAAAYYRVSPRARVQLNVENLGDARYVANAHSDNNISPGAPRTAHLGLHLEF
jgi:catecholate siderophore receptor